MLLAERLRPHRPQIVITSEEPKAAESGNIVADVLGLSRRTAPGLYELDRAGEPYFDDPNDYASAVKAFFESSTEQVFGVERADEAQRRFVKAVKEALASCPEENVALVAHGIVNTLFVAAHNEVGPSRFGKPGRSVRLRCCRGLSTGCSRLPQSPNGCRRRA